MPDRLTLVLSRVLAAPRPAVFAAFSAVGGLARWWGPEGFSMPGVDFAPQAGGRYRIAMQPPEGERFHLSGEFREVDPPARLAFTFAYEEPDPDDVTNLVDLAFRDLGGSTHVALTQAPFRTEARRALHRDGWTQSFDKLERLLAARR